jgi:KUP system potassium uptake protein
MADPEPPLEPPSEAASPSHPRAPGRTPLPLLMLAALGIVFGDIGTSPLYALRECFSGTHAVPPTPQNVLGVLSLITWALLVIMTGKYVGVVMRADNRGEGGILSLTALGLQGITRARKGPQARLVAVTLGLFGASMLFAEGMVTPAISVLSAVEGLKMVTPALDRWILWIATVILVGLFLFQRRGTTVVGRVFGPVTLAWFLSLTALGISSIAVSPEVLRALSPAPAIAFFVENQGRGLLVLGAVFLVVTGGEALYMDMGHFGKRPIRLAWLLLVLPALLLNYFGQGALLLREPAAADNPFFRLAPGWALLPLVGLATLATIVASQALISGAFSLARQAVQLGYSPRFKVVHTSAETEGQIYLPGINWVLLAGVLALVFGFRSSSNLASIYGLSVSATMVITSLLLFLVARTVWQWKAWVTVPLMGLILFVDLSFFGANLAKVPDGAWLAVVIAGVVFILSTTWKRGRGILAERLRTQTFPLDLFLSNVGSNPPMRVPGVAVFMTGNPEGTPAALMHNLKHNKVLHQKVILLSVTTAEVPHVSDEERVEVQPLEHGLYRVVARYGFMENPDVPALFGLLKEKGLGLRMMETTFFLGRETLIPSRKPGMALWREAVFAWMSRNAHAATAYFNLPPNRVVELGAQIEL